METEVSYFSVGMWSARNGSWQDLSLLILPTSFVFLAGRTNKPQSRSRTAVLKQLGAKSPFSSSYYTEGGCVCAFEVPLESIVGLDYHNPLLQPGRVALEVHGVRKREFRTLESARAFYLLNSLPLGGVAAGSVQPPGVVVTPQGSPAALRLGQTAKQQVEQQEQPQQSPEQFASLPSAKQQDGLGQRQQQQPQQQQVSSNGARQGLMTRLEGCDTAERPASAQEAGVAGVDGGSRSDSGSLQSWTNLDEQAADGEPAQPQKPGWVACNRCAGPGNEAKPSTPASSLLGQPAKSAGQPGLPSPQQRQCPHDTPPAQASAGTACERQATGLPWHAAHCDSGTTQGLMADAVASDFWVGSAPTSECLFSLPNGKAVSMRHVLCAQEGPVAAATAPASPAAAQAKPPAPYCQAATGLRHVRSTGDLLGAGASTAGAAETSPQPGQAAQSKGGRLGSRQLSWPNPWDWTTVSDVYEYRTIIFTFTSPEVPGLLQPVIKGNERLLKMCESGLPTWAIFMPAYGFYYRPWLRRMTWFLYYAFSVFSLLCGFYDLYKQLPGFQLLLQRVMASMWLPPGAILQWLDMHSQFRLSILLTYLFGKSEAFVQLMRWAGNVARGVRVALKPVTEALGPPLTALGQALSLLGLQAWQALAGVWLAVGSLLYALLAPFALLAVDLWESLAGTLAPLLLAIHAAVVSPLLWVAAAWGQLKAAGCVFWGGLVEAGRGAAAGAGAVRATVSAGKAVKRNAPEVVSQMSQVSWLYVIPADVYELIHTSVLKVMRAVQTVAKFLVEIGSNLVRHRQSLGLRLERSLRRGRQRLAAWLALPHRALAVLAGWLARLIQVLLRVAVHDSEGRSQDEACETGSDEQPPTDQDIRNGSGDGSSSSDGNGTDTAAAVVTADASIRGLGDGMRHRNRPSAHGEQRAQAERPGEGDSASSGLVAGRSSGLAPCGDCNGCAAVTASAQAVAAGHIKPD